MQLKMTINRARTVASLEFLELENIYSNSVYVHKIIVDANTLPTEVIKANLSYKTNNAEAIVVPL
ncbi:MAG: hypothetical protein RR338_04775, partial [Clostridia bacterium]